MGAGSQSRCNRLLPDLGFRDRSRHKGVHCVRTGYSLEMPSRIAPITALVQAMQASVYSWSSIGSLLGGGGEFVRNSSTRIGERNAGEILDMSLNHRRYAAKSANCSTLQRIGALFRHRKQAALQDAAPATCKLTGHLGESLTRL